MGNEVLLCCSLSNGVVVMLHFAAQPPEQAWQCCSEGRVASPRASERVTCASMLPCDTLPLHCPQQAGVDTSDLGITKTRSTPQDWANQVGRGLETLPVGAAKLCAILDVSMPACCANLCASVGTCQKGIGSVQLTGGALCAMYQPIHCLNPQGYNLLSKGVFEAAARCFERAGDAARAQASCSRREGVAAVATLPSPLRLFCKHCSLAAEAHITSQLRPGRSQNVLTPIPTPSVACTPCTAAVLPAARPAEPRPCAAGERPF